MKKLGQIASIQMGYPFRSRLAHHPMGGMAVVQMRDIDESNVLHLEGAARIDAGAISTHHWLKPGDLVFRSRGNNNSAAMVQPDVGTAVLAAPMLRVRPESILPAYLLWYINLPATQSALAGQAEGTSVRMISKAALEDLPVPVPSLRKQKLIAEIADLAATEQRLMERLARERKRLADGALLRYAVSE